MHFPICHWCKCCISSTWKLGAVYLAAVLQTKIPFPFTDLSHVLRRTYKLPFYITFPVHSSNTVKHSVMTDFENSLWNTSVLSLESIFCSWKRAIWDFTTTVPKLSRGCHFWNTKNRGTFAQALPFWLKLQAQLATAQREAGKLGPPGSMG